MSSSCLLVDNLSTQTTLRAPPGGHGSDATSASALEVKP
jgi:hypothetical protein